MPDLHAPRRECVRRRLAEAELDAIVVCGVSNVRYLTGFTGDSTVLVLARERALLVSDGRYDEQLRQQCPEVEAHIRPVGQLLIPGLAGVLERLAFGAVGFEAAHLCVADHLVLAEALKSVELVPLTGVIEHLRAVKDAAEVAAIRQSIRTAEETFRQVVASLKDQNPTEKELADTIDATLRRQGAENAAFPPIVAAGPHAALPHAQPRSHVFVRDHDFTLIDWGASQAGYKSDLTRMVVTGKVSEKFARVYRAVLSAQLRAIAEIRPGVRACDVDAVARRSLEADGLGEFFTHGLGHGFGLDIHEEPRLRKELETPLEPGMVVTIEPGAYLPGWGGIRIEDDVLVTTDGHEVLTCVSRELESLAVG